MYDDNKTCYQDLASAIIIEACEEYKRGKYSEEAFYLFCHSDWFMVLMGILEANYCGGDWLYEKMKKEKEEFNNEAKHRKHI